MTMPEAYTTPLSNRTEIAHYLVNRRNRLRPTAKTRWPPTHLKHGDIEDAIRTGTQNRPEDWGK